MSDTKTKTLDLLEGVIREEGVDAVAAVTIDDQGDDKHKLQVLVAGERNYEQELLASIALAAHVFEFLGREAPHEDILAIIDGHWDRLASSIAEAVKRGVDSRGKH